MTTPPPRIPGDQATVTVTVHVEPEIAFDVFTREIDRWWKRGPKFRIGGRSPGALQFQPGVGGRLFESFQTASGNQLTEVGRIIAWEPPTRLLFVWRNLNFSPSEQTEVEVTFEPTDSGTRIVLQHRGWAALRPDHPARHAMQGADFSRMIGLWWGELLAALREHLAARRVGPG